MTDALLERGPAHGARVAGGGRFVYVPRTFGDGVRREVYERTDRTAGDGTPVYEYAGSKP